jgi:hypothetical protein
MSRRPWHEINIVKRDKVQGPKQPPVLKNTVLSESQKDAIIGIYKMFDFEDIIHKDVYTLIKTRVDNNENVFKTLDQQEVFNRRLTKLRNKLNDTKNRKTREKRRQLEEYLFYLPRDIVLNRKNRDFTAFLL